MNARIVKLESEVGRLDVRAGQVQDELKALTGEGKELEKKLANPRRDLMAPSWERRLDQMRLQVEALQRKAAGIRTERAAAASLLERVREASGVHAAEAELAAIERDEAQVAKDLRLAEAERPPVAYAAERGNGKDLAALERRVVELKGREVNLAAARRQATWLLQRAKEEALTPLLEQRLAAGQEVTVCESRLFEAIDKAVELDRQIAALGQELAVSLHNSASPGEHALARLAAAVGVRIASPYLPPQTETLAERDAARIGKSLEAFELARRQPGPKALPAKDDATGILGSIMSIGGRLLSGRTTK